MNSYKNKYIYIAIAAIVALATLYVTYSLIKDGHPMVKSQNEHLIKANELHNDSLYEEAVESYMRALDFDKQQSLVNYNIATNSLNNNLKLLTKSFNEEGYILDSTVVSALGDANNKFVEAAKREGDGLKYSEIYYNLGVAKHMQDSLSIAAEAYKETLRKNPSDEDARYNLAVILYQMKQNQQNQQNQQQNQENKQQQQQQQQDKEERDKKEQQKEKENQQQDKENKENKEDKEQQQKEQKKQDEELEKIEQMLKALMQDEKKIREKLEEKEGIKVNRSIEKNW